MNAAQRHEVERQGNEVLKIRDEVTGLKERLAVILADAQGDTRRAMLDGDLDAAMAWQDVANAAMMLLAKM